MNAFDHVTVGLDFNATNASTVLHRTVQLTQSDHIHALHVVPVDAQKVEPGQKSWLRNLCAEYGVASIEFVTGDAAHKLHEHAAPHSDLIVVGSHGNSGLNGILHSHSNAALHGTPCDMLTIRLSDRAHTEPPPYRHILVALNLEHTRLPAECQTCSCWEESRNDNRLTRSHRMGNALRPTLLFPRRHRAEREPRLSLCHVPTEVLLHARQVAQKCRAKLSLCHVYESYDNATQTMERDLLERLGSLYDIPRERLHTAPGSIASVIHRLADRIGADLVVVGTHGRSGLALTRGTTANSVLHGATCDQLSVRINR